MAFFLFPCLTSVASRLQSHRLLAYAAGQHRATYVGSDFCLGPAYGLSEFALVQPRGAAPPSLLAATGRLSATTAAALLSAPTAWRCTFVIGALPTCCQHHNLASISDAARSRRNSVCHYRAIASSSLAVV